MSSPLQRSRPSLWRTVVTTAAVVFVAPWTVAIVWGTGRLDTVVAFWLLLATPGLLIAGLVLGLAMYGLRRARYQADELQAAELREERPS